MSDKIIVHGPLMKAHPDDAGWDILAKDGASIAPGQTIMIAGGVVKDGEEKSLQVEIPSGTVGLVCSRSGLAAKNSIAVLNSPGVVDSGFDGIVNVILHNFHPTDTFEVTPGQRIAQFVFMDISSKEVVGDDLIIKYDDRGEGGFGSSGTH